MAASRAWLVAVLALAACTTRRPVARLTPRAAPGVPRFAGVGYGGRVTVAGVTVTLEGRFAWVLLDYRWFNLTTNQAEAGRATFVFEEKPDGWKIIHVHSSQVLPWDR